jgi:hypothetical protein
MAKPEQNWSQKLIKGFETGVLGQGFGAGVQG